jgi:drug/metabolite transporter (DMT)-like permease
LYRLLLLLTVVIWGSSFVASRVALQEVGAVDLMSLRLLLALPILGTLLIARRTSLRLHRAELVRLGLAAVVLTAHFLVQITGLKYTSATNTGWLISVTPLALALISTLFLGEKLGGRAAVGIAVATLGVVLLVSRGELDSLAWLRSVGDWLVLASAFTWAIYTALLRDLSRARDPLLVTTVVLVPPLVLGAALISAGDGWSRFLHLSLRADVAILFLAVLATALAHWLWQLGVAALGAARAGVFLYVEPLATTAVAVPYLHEPFGWSTAAGGLLVLGGVYVAERRASRVTS